jgi:hypothetical protein
MVALDSSNKSTPPPDKGSGCGGCLGALLVAVLLLTGVLAIIHAHQPDPPVPSPPAVYAGQPEATPDAPRAELVSDPVQAEPTLLQVRRATLVRLPEVRRAVLVKLP